MDGSARDIGPRPERVDDASTRQDTSDKPPRPSYTAADKAAREASEAYGNEASKAKIAQIKEAMHGDTSNSLGVPKVGSVDRGYAEAVNKQAEASVQKEYKDLSAEAGLSIADIKMLENKYDRLSAEEKADAGLPEHFDQIVTTPGKKPPTSKFGRFLSRFTGSGARMDLFDKAAAFIADNDPDALPNPEGGEASSKFASGKKQAAKIDRSGMGGPQ